MGSSLNKDFLCNGTTDLAVQNESELGAGELFGLSMSVAGTATSDCQRVGWVAPTKGHTYLLTTNDCVDSCRLEKKERDALRAAPRRRRQLA